MEFRLIFMVGVGMGVVGMGVEGTEISRNRKLDLALVPKGAGGGLSDGGGTLPLTTDRAVDR